MYSEYRYLVTARTSTEHDELTWLCVQWRNTDEHGAAIAVVLQAMRVHRHAPRCRVTRDLSRGRVLRKTSGIRIDALNSGLLQLKLSQAVVHHTQQLKNRKYNAYI